MNILSPSPEYIRAVQKDNEYGVIFKKWVLKVSETLLGRGSMRYVLEISSLAELLYHITNLVLSRESKIRQTPGEEYASVSLAEFHKVSKVRRVLVSTNYPAAARMFAPSTLRMLAYILIKTGLPYIIHKLSALQNSYKQTKTTKDWKDCLPSLDEVYEELISHSIFSIFLLGGMYDDLAKRLTNIVYVKLDRSRNHGTSYRNLGYILILHILFTTFSILKKFLANLKDLSREKEAGISSGDLSSTESRCVICLNNYRFPSCGPCGHVFCWDCIIKYTQLKQECPQCRQLISAQSVVQIRNYY